MAKNIRRMLAMAMVLCLFAGMVPLQALAADGTETTETTETSPEGLNTEVTTSTTTSTDENGNTTVTVTIEKETKGTTEDNVIVNRTETSTTTTTNADGDVTEQTVTEGSETKEWDEDVQPGQKVPDVTVELKPGETVEVSVKGETDTDTTGDEPEGPDDKEYDYTETTVEVDRTVTGTLTNVEESFVINPEESTLACPIDPENDGKNYFTGEGNYHSGLMTGNYVQMYDPQDKPGDDGYEKGYDLTWIGLGDITEGAVAVFVEKLVYLVDDDGETVYENGFPVVDMEKSKFVQGQNKKAYTENGQDNGMVGQSMQFVLRHENGEYFYAYCMDAATSTGPEADRWYNIHNLEDAIVSEENPDGYITEDEAAKIRAIATNGYWGTAEGRGSLESLKELLMKVYDEEDVINVRYPGSNVPTSYNIYELIDGLKEYEALAATQAAIWTYANNNDVTYRNNAGEILVEGASVIGVLSASKYKGLNEYKPAEDGECDARLQALYQALLMLDPIYADGELREDSTVIPNENVVTDVALVVHDKVADDDRNLDTNNDNDVYNTDLNFKLAIVPGENDDLTVMLQYTDADGNEQTVIRSLGGKNSGNNEVITSVDGVYTLTGLKLSERQGTTFDLRLEGTQYLNEGVYIYQAEGGRRESQTLVGLAEGTQKVEVSTKMTIKFDVDEDNHVVAERTWHNESDPIYTPGDTPVPLSDEPGDEPGDGPRIYRLGRNEDVVEIPDEEVPLASAPTTGDVSGLWIAVILVAAVGLFVVNVISKKGKYEAF